MKRDPVVQKEVTLVTGGCGYIGSHVVRQLSEAGHLVVVLDNLSTGFRDSLLGTEELLNLDLGDRSGLHAAFERFRPRSVLHFAASIVVPESIKNPLSYYRNNTANTIHLLEACQQWGVEHFVFSSTAAVYGTGRVEAVREDDPTTPSHPYGWSKLMDEQIIRDFAQASALRFVILRYFNVAGAEPEGRLGQKFPAATHLIKMACEAALQRRPKLEIYGGDYQTHDGTCIRDFVHVEDLAQAHLLALAYLHNGGKSEIMNCGYGHGYSVKEVVDAVQRVSGETFPVHFAGRRPGDIAQLTADPSKIKALLGWQPRWNDLDAIVRSALRWDQFWFGKGEAGNKRIGALA